MIEHIHVKGYRLFKDFETDLRPGLNVLIGANGSGKSSFVELLRIVQACCYGRLSHGVETRPYPGEVFRADSDGSLTWGITLSLTDSGDGRPPRRCFHSLRVAEPAAPVVAAEALSRLGGKRGARRVYPKELRAELIAPEEPYRLLFAARAGQGTLFELGTRMPWVLTRDEPFLSRMTDPRLRDSAGVRNEILLWRFYSEFHVTRSAPIRHPQALSAGTELKETGENLTVALLSLLSNMEHRERADELLALLRTAVPEFEGLAQAVDTSGRYAVLQWRERGVGTTLAAADLPDGYLRLLLLGAVCCAPHLPKLICIDEPEIGLHPRFLPIVGGLLRRTARRTQVIVLTHSPDLLCGMALESIAVLRKRDGVGQIVWPAHHGLLLDILTEDVATREGVDRERLRRAFTSGELDELG